MALRGLETTFQIPCQLHVFHHHGSFGSIVPPFGSIMAHFGSIVSYFCLIKSSSAQIVQTFSDSGPLRLDDKKLQPPDSADFSHEWAHFGSIKSSNAQIVKTFSDSDPRGLDVSDKF